MHAGKRTLFLLAAGLTISLGGCATRSSVELAQNSANAADAHAGDARSRADAAQNSANAAQASANQAAGVGGNALTLAQTDAQRVDVLTTELDTAKSKIAYLQRNVVFKKVKHRARHHVHHTAAATKPKAEEHTGM